MFSVAVVHQKGGSGKSTLTVNLAAAAHLEGRLTCIADLDAQGSALAWSAARREGSRLEGIAVMGPGYGDADKAVAKSGRTIAVARLRELTRPYQVALLDCPAREHGITRSAAIFADVALIPIVPGAFDFWAVPDTRASLDAADEVRAELGRPPIIRCCVVNAGRGSRLIREAHDAIKAEGIGIDLGEVHHRLAFPAAVDRGESVLTLPAPIEAADEIRRLWKALKGTAHGTLIKAPKQTARSREGQGTRSDGHRDGRRRVSVRG